MSVFSHGFLRLGVELGNLLPLPNRFLGVLGLFNFWFILEFEVRGIIQRQQSQRRRSKSKCDYLFSPPSPFSVEIQLSSLSREAELSASDPAVVSQDMATLQTPGDSQEDCHRNTEVLVTFVISLRRKAA